MDLEIGVVIFSTLGIYNNEHLRKICYDIDLVSKHCHRFEQEKLGTLNIRAIGLNI